MINNTKMRIPKKYEHMIEEINHDQDGYWVALADGFYSAETGSHTIHEETQKDTLACIRNIKEETYDLVDEDGTCIAEDMSLEQAVERYKTTKRTQNMFSRQLGSDVEKIWSTENLKRNNDIVMKEITQDLEEITVELSLVHDIGDGVYGDVHQGEDREKLLKEYDRLNEALARLEEEIKATESVTDEECTLGGYNNVN